MYWLELFNLDTHQDLRARKSIISRSPMLDDSKNALALRLQLCQRVVTVYVCRASTRSPSQARGNTSSGPSDELHRHGANSAMCQSTRKSLL